MIPGIFTDIVPKAVLAGAVLWAGAHYFVVGPAIASRVVRFDFLPGCEAGYRDVTLRAAEDRARAIRLPSVSPDAQIVTEMLRGLQNNPLLQELQRPGGMGDLLGLGDIPGLALRKFNRAREQTEAAYRQSMDRLERETATNLAQAGSVCSCAADLAIADTRKEWAFFSGSLGFVRDERIAAFGETMARLPRVEVCGMARSAS
ncbi:MAG: hypothetical protein AB7P20_03080 [Rhizobiaceae bacterium]